MDSTNVANTQSFTETSDIISNVNNYEEIAEGQSELSEEDIEQMLLTKIALFRMNLQVKHHVPSRVVQVVISEISELVSKNTDAIKNRVSRMLSDYDIANELVENIIL